MKSLSIRLKDPMGRKFDVICREEGYKKNGVVVRLIEAFVKNRESQRKSSKRLGSDPFLEVIGIYKGPLLSSTSEEIDRLVYNI